LVTVVLLVVVVGHIAAAKSTKGKKGKKPVLPPAAVAAIKKAFPKASIDEVKREKEVVVLYEVELEGNGKDVEVKVTPAGQIVEVETKVVQGDLPEPVAKTLANLAGDAEVKEVEKKEIRAVIKVVELKKSQVVYEAEFVKNGKEVEVKIAEDGKLVGKKAGDGDDEDKDEGEEGEREVKVSISQVPPAVKATILNEAGANEIKEIEKKTKGGKTIYEAEWIVGGKETEVKVAEDGKLLGKEVEDDEDD